RVWSRQQLMDSVWEDAQDTYDRTVDTHIKTLRAKLRAMLHFCENPGKIQSRAELLKKMTGRELKPHDRTVDVTIRRIRKHFESTPDTPEIIATIHGEGYRFCGDLED
ncbi:winged helix-turn-helix domain-containing protein, partial [Escherichia coli]|uniref:winged helix-turn-helix domain-containing protein n=1 Tax=Escherichia coli TaxID=562 RepID=UPI00208DB808